MKRVGDTFEIRTGYTFRDSIADLKEGNVAIIQAGDINAAQLANVPRIEFVSSKHLLQAGDIMLSARGRTVARTVTPDLLPAVAASSVLVLRPLKEINSKFIARFFNSPTGQSALAKIKSGSYIKTLRKAELEDLVIPIPPVSTQQTIVNLADTIEQQQAILALKSKLFTDVFNQAMKLEGATQ